MGTLEKKETKMKCNSSHSKCSEHSLYNYSSSTPPACKVLLGSWPIKFLIILVATE